MLRQGLGYQNCANLPKSFGLAWGTDIYDLVHFSMVCSSCQVKLKI
ncbi:unnamed protein product [Mycena citricolor]|uniref:Uncharacterized protein n=1 Tax=Mycena citricolor TaxID=2018698 RepID=A0AAD2JX76_9AGAR|nr:unnamed protein product [Mycena citricolor]CAK5266862.1 unnamed protein product [Mycena citricolor]CAK5268146.1 unnamed protein product [Mycena citricolor]CAK5268257.1 unnamed protein product [Mycena citricolor]CAK5268669.1 unnamed protein product [Mycena citricolor]